MITLTMKFKNKEGKNITIRVPKAKANLTKTQVDGLMDLIIDKNIFYTGLAELSEKVSCELTTVAPLV